MAKNLKNINIKFNEFLERIKLAMDIDKKTESLLYMGYVSGFKEGYYDKD